MASARAIDIKDLKDLRIVFSLVARGTGNRERWCARARMIARDRPSRYGPRGALGSSDDGEGQALALRAVGRA